MILCWGKFGGKRNVSLRLIICMIELKDEMGDLVMLVAHAVCLLEIGPGLG